MRRAVLNVASEGTFCGAVAILVVLTAFPFLLDADHLFGTKRKAMASPWESPQGFLTHVGIFLTSTTANPTVKSWSSVTYSPSRSTRGYHRRPKLFGRITVSGCGYLNPKGAVAIPSALLVNV